MSLGVTEFASTMTRARVAASSRVCLQGARVALDAGSAAGADLEITNGRIRSLIPDGARGLGTGALRKSNQLTIDLSGYMVLPGLINAHDHLEFNLFPRLGHGPYGNSEQWAQDIYHPNTSPLLQHLAVPKPVRLWWGGMKNLLSGVTTVCHHNPYQAEVFEDNFPVHVVRDYGWAHSIKLEKDIPAAYARTPRDAPFIIHACEGTDARSRDEVFFLDELGCLSSRTVIVHGVGLDAAGHNLLKRRRAALIWCPTSNHFTLGASLDRQVVLGSSRIALGSDSGLTASGDLLDEIRAARRLLGTADEKIYAMVTTGAADVLRLKRGEGTIKPGGPADLIAIRDTGLSPAACLSQSSFRKIELAIIAGEVRLISPALAGRFPPQLIAGLEPFVLEQTERLVRAPVASLIESTSEQLHPHFWLAGKLVTQ